MLTSSLTPSINLKFDERLARFNIKIGNSPELIFEEDIQKEIQSFIAKRFELDKAFVKEKTNDVAKLIAMMCKYINDAINQNAIGTQNVSGFKEQIKAIDISKNQSVELSEIQSKLVDAVENIESEMAIVENKFKNEMTNVYELEKKIKKLEKELEQTNKESRIDFLTGVLTRRAFEEELIRIESNHKRNNVEYAIVFFDIDFFKKVNDTYGHDAGDAILKTFAKLLHNQTREYDTICRYGGEEFLVIAHFKQKIELLTYLKRIKSIVANNSFIYKDKRISLTFSAGVAIRSNYKTFDDAIKEADNLLYKSKNNGRDQIRIDDNESVL